MGRTGGGEREREQQQLGQRKLDSDWAVVRAATAQRLVVDPAAVDPAGPMPDRRCTAPATRRHSRAGDLK